MSASKIQILDCSKSTEVEFAQKLGEAFKGAGFIQLVNHGLDTAVIENMFQKLDQFFELPLEVKMKYDKVDPLEIFQGFTSSGHEILHEHDRHNDEDFNETWDNCVGESIFPSIFPTEVDGFKSGLENGRQAMIPLIKKILKSVAVCLKLKDQDFFLKKHKNLDNAEIKTREVFRAYYFHPLELNIKVGETYSRLAEHSAWGSVVLIYPDQIKGLEIQDRITKEWLPVAKVQGSIGVFPALMMENWSGGLIHAPRYRIRGSEETAHLPKQIAVYYYVQPDASTTCLPVLDEHHAWDPRYPKKHQMQTHDEYFKDRVRGSRKPGKTPKSWKS